MTDENLRGRTLSPRVLLLFAVLLVAAFSAGFLWQYVEVRSVRAELDEVQRELTFQQLATRLGSAVIQADNDAYESARQQMSSFFAGLDAAMDQAPLEARPELEEIMQRRDAVITALSRSDQASEELLGRIFTRYQVVMGGPDVGIPIPAPRAADTPALDTGAAAGQGSGGS